MTHDRISALTHDQTFTFFSKKICSSAFSLHLNDVSLNLSDSDRHWLDVLAKADIFSSFNNSSRRWLNVLARANIFSSLSNSSRFWFNVLARVNIFFSFNDSGRSWFNVLAKADVLLTRNNDVLKSSLRLLVSSWEFLQSLRNSSDSLRECW